MYHIRRQEIRNGNGGPLRFRYVAARGYVIELVQYIILCPELDLPCGCILLYLVLEVCIKASLFHYLTAARHFRPKILYANHGRHHVIQGAVRPNFIWYVLTTKGCTSYKQT